MWAFRVAFLLHVCAIIAFPVTDRATDLPPPATQQVIDAAVSMATYFAGYELTYKQNQVFSAAFNLFLSRHEGLQNSTVLLQRLSLYIDPVGFANLSAQSGVTPPVFGVTELQRLLAYAEFVKEVLGNNESIPLEVRLEGWKAYAVVPPQWSLIRTLNFRALLWVYTKDWALDRCYDGGKDLGLCGQSMGKSKFVTPSDQIPASKDAALDELGLRHYRTFDKPGTLYVVRAELNPIILKHASPAVPLLYQTGQPLPSSGALPGYWVSAPNFQEGTIPGFTSGLKAELVMKTFQLSVSSAAELEQEGISCHALPDDRPDPVVLLVYAGIALVPLAGAAAAFYVWLQPTVVSTDDARGTEMLRRVH